MLTASILSGFLLVGQMHLSSIALDNKFAVFRPINPEVNEDVETNPADTQLTNDEQLNDAPLESTQRKPYSQYHWNVIKSSFTGKGAYVYISTRDISRLANFYKNEGYDLNLRIPSSIFPCTILGKTKLNGNELFFVSVEPKHIKIPVSFSQLVMASDYLEAKKLIGKRVYSRGLSSSYCWDHYDYLEASSSKNQAFVVEKVQLIKKPQDSGSNDLVVSLRLKNKWITYNHHFDTSDVSFKNAFTSRYSFADFVSYYSKRFGHRFGKLIADERIQIGMTTTMVRAAWGEPKDINRSVGSWGVQEQWVYQSNYVYFDNGVVTGWQD